VADCRLAGMDSHLSKPFTYGTLLAAILAATAAGPLAAKAQSGNSTTRQ
jgi:CheY-like chemotaxis protein